MITQHEIDEDFYHPSGFNYRRPFQTKCGWPARLVGVLQRRAFPLVVAIHNPAFGAEELHCYNSDGKQPERAEYPKGEGSLSLVNIPEWLDEDRETRYLKSTDFVHASVTHELPPMDLSQSSNPFHYDHSSMGTELILGWYAMHGGFGTPDRDNALSWIELVNTKSGQRIHINLATKKVV